MTETKISANRRIDAALHLDGNPEHVRAYYEDWAQHYNLDIGRADYSGPAIAVKLLQAHLSATDSRLLDAGCGTGLVGTELQKSGYRNIDGFDLSESMAQQAVATGAYRQVLGGIDMLRAAQSYVADAYAAVLSVGVFTLGHVPPEALEVLLELAAPGGLVLVSTRTHYYEESGFQQVVDGLVKGRRAKLLQLVKDAPYNNDGDGHYWVFAKTSR